MSRKRRRHGHSAPLMVSVVVGLVLSLVLFAVVWQRAHNDVALGFERKAFPLAESIDVALEERLDDLRSHASFYQIRGQIDRAQFRALVSQAIGTPRGIQAIEWIPRVPATTRAEHEATARADGFPRYEILQHDGQRRMVRASNRADYFPVYYVEPLAGNERALGFDLGSEPTRRAALERALASGAPAATAPVTLLQERGTQHGVLVFVPVYAHGARMDTVDQRRAGLAGFILGVFRVGALVEASLRRLDASGIEIEVSDVAAPVGERLLYRSAAHGGPARGILASLAWTTTLDVAGRRWALAFRPTTDYVVSGAWAPWRALALGLVFTALVTLSVAAGRAVDLGRSNARLKAEIAERERAFRALAESERRYRLLADNAKDVISVFDLELKLLYVSPSVTQLRGFTVEEAMRQTLAERLTPASVELARQTLEEARAGAAAGIVAGWRTLELEMRCKDGSTVWVESTLSFLRDDAGRPTGILSVSRDITERKRAAERMSALADVGRALSQSLDPAAAAALVVESVCTLLGAKSAAIYRIDRRSEEIVLQASFIGRKTDFHWSERLSLHRSFCGVAVRERRSVVAADVLHDSRFAYGAEVQARVEAVTARAMLAVPLRAQDHTFGVLGVSDSTGREFAASDVAVAEAFADRAAIALENARLFAAAERRRKAAESLADLERLISRSLDPDVVAQQVADSLGALLGARSATVFRLDEPSGVLRVIATWGDVKPVYDRSLAVPVGAGMVGLAVRDRRPAMTQRVLTDPRANLSPDMRRRLELLGNYAVLAVPLIAQGHVIGAIGVGDIEGRVFDEDEVRLTEDFAHQAALAMENARLHSETTTRLTHTQALLEVGQAVGSTLDPTEASRRTIRVAVRALGADLGAIAAVMTGREEIVPLAAYRLPKELLHGAVTAVPAGRILESLRAHGVLASSDSQGDPILRERPWVRGIPHRSMLVAPLSIKDEIVGVMAIVWVRGRHDFTGNEIDLIGGVARQAAIGIENARLVEQLRTRQSRLEALVETSRELSRIQPLGDLLSRIADGCGRLLDAPLVGFRVVEGDELVLAGASGSSRCHERVLTEPLGIAASASGTAVVTGEPLVINDLDADTRMVAAHRDALVRLGYHAYLTVPVKVGERVAGVLNVCRGAGYSDEDLAIASAFASQAATALENARLYQEVQRAYTELSSTQDQLVQAQKMEAIGQLAGGVAHDFNNLMTVVVGRAALLKSQLGTGHALGRHVDLIRTTAERATRVTRQLLAFSRKQVLQPKIVDLNRLVSGTSTMLRPLIGEDIELVTVPGADLSPVRIDPSQFEQVLVNLAINARDAMPRGGRLTIETANVSLDERRARTHLGLTPGPYVMLAVSDTGCGMDAETVAHIFEPFFTTKERGKGTGLGLAMVYGTVKQSGGNVYVYSEPGMGTSFKIYLPPAERPVEPGVARALPSAAPRGTETILLVEDEESVRELLREVLVGLGYTVLIAADGHAALEICTRHEGAIHLVLTDVVMPRMGGPEMARQLAGIRPDLKVLYMSGYADGAIVHHGVLDRGTAFLQKPFEPDNVGRKIRQVLDATGHSISAERATRSA